MKNNTTNINNERVHRRFWKELSQAVEMRKLIGETAQGGLNSKCDIAKESSSWTWNGSESIHSHGPAHWPCQEMYLLCARRQDRPWCLKMSLRETRHTFRIHRGVAWCPRWHQRWGGQVWLGHQEGLLQDETYLQLRWNVDPSPSPPGPGGSVIDHLDHLPDSGGMGRP